MTNNPENTRGTRKTQARADPDDTTSPNTTTTTPPSLGTRIQSSAAGLARSAFQPGSADNVASTLASATDGKTGSGGPSSARGGQGYTASQETHPPPLRSSTTGAGAGYAGASFRERGSGIPAGEGGFTLPEMTEEEFQRGEAYTSSDTPMMTGGAGDTRYYEGHIHMERLQGATGTWKGKQVARDPVQLEYTTAWERAGAVSSVPVDREGPATINPSDGAAVVSLLSDASFDPNGDPSTEELDVDMAASPPPLTASEIETLESFRREVGSSSGGNGSVSGQPQLSSLSLVPDIDAFLQQNDPAGIAHTRATGDVNASLSNSDATLRDNVLDNLPGAADWVGVQERYHDEVWGYLRPALEAARAEMEERGEGGEAHGEDGPAVRRLKMILKHMKA